MRNKKNRFLGIFLSATMIAGLMPASLATTVNAGILFSNKSEYYSAETRKNDESVYCEGFNDFSSGVMSIQLDQAKLIANDYVGFVNNDLETSMSDTGMLVRSPYRKFYVSTYGLNAEESEKRADEFKEQIAEYNAIYGDNSIAYEADQVAPSAAANLFSEAYSVADSNVDKSKLPAMLETTEDNASIKYNYNLSELLGSSVNDPVVDLCFNVEGLSGLTGLMSLNITNTENNKLITRKIIKTNGLVDLKSIKVSEKFSVSISFSKKNTRLVNMSLVAEDANKRSGKGSEDDQTRLIKVFLTSEPVPETETTRKSLSEEKRLSSYSKNDDMYIVMEFSDDVTLSRKIYRDGGWNQYIQDNLDNTEGQAYNIAYYGYPRLALATTDAGNMEQQDKGTTVYADYFGTMSSGNTGKSHDCLIFKVDKENIKYSTFCIAALGDENDKYNRTGNMEWIYDSNAINTIRTSYVEGKKYPNPSGEYWIKRVYPNVYSRYVENKGWTFNKSAISDSKGNAVFVNEGAPLESKILSDGKEIYPMYVGANPCVTDVTITNSNGGSYAKKGDVIKAVVKFNTVLDTNGDTPKFYLNDFANNGNPASDGFDGTVLENGSYSTTEMIPLTASWKVKEGDANNTISVANASEADSARGAATFTITGTEDADNTEIYYKQVTSNTVAPNVGDEFDLTGYQKYTAPVYLTNLINTVYLNKDGNLTAIRQGGFLDIVQVKKDTEGVYRVVKFGETDSIDTSSDSENVQVQNNTPVTSTIVYTTQLTGNADFVKNLKLIEKKTGALYFGGNVKNAKGESMDQDKNFGSFDSAGEFTANGLQDCKLSIDNITPVIKNASDSTTYKANEAGCVYKFYEDLNHDGSGLKEVIVQTSALDSAIDLVAYENNQELGKISQNKGESNSLTIPLNKAFDTRTIQFKIVLKEENGSFNKVSVPVDIKAYDEAGNVTTVSRTFTIGLPYAEFDVASSIDEGTAQTYIEDADKEQTGRIDCYAVISDASDDFDVRDLKVAIKDDDTVPTESEYQSLNKNYSDGNMSFDTPFKAGENTVKAYCSIETDENGTKKLHLFMAGLPQRGAKYDGKFYVTYSVEKNGVTNNYSTVVYADSGDYKDRTSLQNYKCTDFHYDTKAVAKAVSRKDNEEALKSGYAVVTVEHSEDPLKGFSVSLDPSMYVNGQIKRSDNYKFNITTDAFTEVRFNFDCGWYSVGGSGNTDVRGFVPRGSFKNATIDDAGGYGIYKAEYAGSLPTIENSVLEKAWDKVEIGKTDTSSYIENGTRSVTLNSRDCGMVYIGDNPYNGGAWVYNFKASFRPIVYMKKTTQKYKPKTNAAGVVVRDDDNNIIYVEDGEPTVSFEMDSDASMAASTLGQNYNLDLLDAEFVRRSGKYADLSSNTDKLTGGSYNYSNRVFLEMDLDYNSLNGYYDNVNPGGYSKRSLTKTNGLFDTVTMTLPEDVSEYLNPETDIDFENSFIYIYPITGITDEERAGTDAYWADYKRDTSKSYVRKIPLPAAFHKVKYSAGGAGEKTVLGFDVDLNAYSVSQDSEGNTVYSFPEEGEYGAFVEIATYIAEKDSEGKIIKDENGKEKHVVISSNHYALAGEVADNKFTLKSPYEAVKFTLPDVIFGYDYSAPDAKLYFKDEVVSYVRENVEKNKSNPTEGIPNNDYGVSYGVKIENTYNLDKKIICDLAGEKAGVYKSGSTVSLYVANPSGDIQGYTDNNDADTDKNIEWPKRHTSGSYAEYAVVPSKYIDIYGNLKAEYAIAMNEKREERGSVTDGDHFDGNLDYGWNSDWHPAVRSESEYALSIDADTGRNIINIQIPEEEDLKDNIYYVLVRVVDNVGNVSDYDSVKLIIDNKAPSAYFYKYRNADDAEKLRLIMLSDNCSFPGDIVLKKKKVADNAKESINVKALNHELDTNTEYVVISDVAGNEATINYNSESTLTLKAPTVSDETGFLRKEPGNNDVLSDDDAKNALEVATPTSYNEANSTFSFKVKPEFGNAVYVDYAWDDASYKRLYSVTSSDDYGCLWQGVNAASNLASSNVVNAIVSEAADSSGYYTVSAKVVLPAYAEAYNFGLMFRVRNAAGLSYYVAVKYNKAAVTVSNPTYARIYINSAGAESTDENDNPTNAVDLSFDEPVRILDSTVSGVSGEFSSKHRLYIDESGKLTVKYANIQGEEKTCIVNYSAADNAPHINVTDLTKGSKKIEFLTDYSGSYIISDSSVKTGVGYELKTVEDKYKYTNNDMTGWYRQEAQVNKDCTIRLDMLKIGENRSLASDKSFFYIVSGIKSVENNCTINYSRTYEDTNDANSSEAVTASIIIPGDAEVISAGGDSHVFYKNGQYCFTVRFADGTVSDFIASVDYIKSSSIDENDNTAPCVFPQAFIVNGNEKIALGEMTMSDPLIGSTTYTVNSSGTTSNIAVVLNPMDINPTTKALNPVTVSLEECDFAHQDVYNEDTIIFTGNGTATVKVSDANRNTTTVKLVVDSINDDKSVTGTIRYVRDGLTSVKAYIDYDKENGISLADMNGIRTDDSGDYHLFTDSGSFTFYLKNANGSVANITTKYVNIVREPLILEKKSPTPEKPGWGESQIVTVTSNLNLKEYKLLEENSDVESTKAELSAQGSNKLLVKLHKNGNYTLRAVAINGSVCDLPISTSVIRIDDGEPVINVTTASEQKNGGFLVTATLTDHLPESIVRSGEELSMSMMADGVEGGIQNLKIEDTTTTTASETVTLTKKLTFIATKTGNYTIYGYDAAGNAADKKTVAVTVDSEAPELSVTSNESVGTYKKDAQITVASNENVVLTFKGKSEDVVANVQKSFTVNQNGTYSFVATDTVGNVTEKKIEIKYIDNDAPVINLKSSGIKLSLRDIDSLDTLKSKILALAEISDVSGIAEKKVIFAPTPDLTSQSDQSIIAYIQASDNLGNIGKASVSVSLKVNEIAETSTVTGFCLKDKLLSEGAITISTDRTLEFRGIPEGAILTIAKGKKTGAQMKGQGSIIENGSYQAESGLYTLKLKLNDATLHIYYISVN